MEGEETEWKYSMSNLLRRSPSSYLFLVSFYLTPLGNKVAPSRTAASQIRPQLSGLLIHLLIKKLLASSSSRALITSFLLNANCSCLEKSLLREIRISKSTECPSNSGPSTQTNLDSFPILTRQLPHIPVPSTMIGFRLTLVFIR